MRPTQRIVYRVEGGNLRRLITDEPLMQRQEATIATMEDRVVKDLHALECKEGARFRVGEFSGAQLKRIWIDNRERDNAFDNARDAAFRRIREQHQ